MLPVAMAAAMAMQMIDKKRKQEEARNQAQASVWDQHAKSMGAPRSGYQGAMMRNHIDDIEGEDYLKDLLPLLQQQSGSK